MSLEKSAQTQYPVHDPIRKRWSPRAFSPEPVEPEKLNSLLEAARGAPSSFNEQPWSFILAIQSNQTEFNRLLSCLAEANQIWAKNAAILMLSVAKLHFEHKGKENRHAFHEVGAAAANLTLQATLLGLFVHQMAGFDPGKARKTFSIPEGYEPVAAIAVGYGGDPETLPDSLHDRELAPRTRKPLQDFVFTEAWGSPFPMY